MIEFNKKDSPDTNLSTVFNIDRFKVMGHEEKSFIIMNDKVSVAWVSIKDNSDSSGNHSTSENMQINNNDYKSLMHYSYNKPNNVRLMGEFEGIVVCIEDDYTTQIKEDTLMGEFYKYYQRNY